MDEAAIASSIIPRMHAVVDDADDEEQGGRDDAVAQHLEDGALMPCRLGVKMPAVTKPIWATEE